MAGVDQDVEFLDVGPDPDDPRRARRRWLGWLLAAVVAAGVVAVLIRNGSKTLPTARHTPALRPPLVVTRSEQPDPPPPIDVTNLGRPVLEEAADLYGRGDGVVVRVQLARGRITRTAVPMLQSTGPVDFVPTAGRVFIHPLDSVPGYVVRDGRQAVATPATGNPLLPGPDAERVWMASGGALALTSLAGQKTGTVIALMRGTALFEAMSDGEGYALLTTPSGVFDARPHSSRRITTGTLLAVGRTGWLVVENCARQCTSVLVNDTTDIHRVLGPTPPGGRGPIGAISPDGTTAAMFAISRTGQKSLYLLDLRSGTRRPVHMAIEQAVVDGVVAWAPDSRFLLALGPTGRVRVVDTSGHVRPLGIALPPLTQLAIRPEPAG
jgi:hypothetical protein